MKPLAGGKFAHYSMLGLLILPVVLAQATVPDPGGGGGSPPPEPLDYWSFWNTNTWASDRGYAPISFTNLDSSWLGNWTALRLDQTNAAWLRYQVVEADGTNHLKLDRGCVLFWFAPGWSGTNVGGNGPGHWGRLLEVGSYTTNASYGWWSILVDPAGANVYFCAQTNGAETTYLAAPIEWTTNYWHQLALNYSATNTALYVDGVLATNGPGVTLWPGPDVLTNGFFIGSDSTGTAQARGMFDDLATYAEPLAAGLIKGYFNVDSFVYYMNPANLANLLGSAESSPTYGPQFNAVTGMGSLTAVGTNSVGCFEHERVWFTNVVATPVAGGKMNVTFTVAGGTNAARYDVFANSILLPAASTGAWAWMGQGYHCSTYTVPNLPGTAAFLVLGTPRDGDFDGLTDAYENLVSKTDPTDSDTDGDGVLDGWEVAFGLAPKNQDSDGDGVLDQPFKAVLMRPRNNSTIP